MTDGKLRLGIDVNQVQEIVAALWAVAHDLHVDVQATADPVLRHAMETRLCRIVSTMKELNQAADKQITGTRGR